MTPAPVIVLRPCQLCGGEARFIEAEDFHLSFAIYSGEEVEHNFLHYGAISCSGCSLTLPFFGSEENKQDNINHWNGEEP